MTMAAATHTDMQAHVQEELDNIVGHTQCKLFFEILPQVTMFMLGSLRWRPVSLGGFVHCATKAIIWKNYLIPASATSIGNHWAIANDPEVFLEPLGCLCGLLEPYIVDVGCTEWGRVSKKLWASAW
ncbi:hypothetical protein EV424DRAFT_1534314 [Suillus variegatus]|nr:hypothetical protein EV424DRAFT_1534314 [Suillus variegatus]